MKNCTLENTLITRESVNYYILIKIVQRKQRNFLFKFNFNSDHCDKFT